MTRKGFSLVELLVSMAIVTILMFMVGAVSGVSHRGYVRTRAASQISADLGYAVKFMQRYLRPENLFTSETKTGSWSGPLLVFDNSAFGVYISSTTNEYQLVYLQDKSDESDREVLVAVEGTDLTFSFTIRPEAVDITIAGTNKGIPFSVTTTVTERV